MDPEYQQYEIKPDIINYDDIRQMVPKLDGHEKLVNALLHFLSIDKVNMAHRHCCDTPGPEFCRRLLFEEFKIKLRVDNEQVLDHLPQGAFITVSNHPFGAIDGITLIHLIGSRRPKFRVMVNMLLNHISAMRPNFIAVDALQTDDPEKRKVSIRGIRQALQQIKDGEPLGFFPAGSMSKLDKHLRLEDRPWQESILQIIFRSKVPVIPIFFHGGNSWFFNLLGVTWWQGRSLRLPAEVFRKCGKEVHVSIGDPISPQEQAAYDSPLALGKFLREKTYALRQQYK